MLAAPSSNTDRPLRRAKSTASARTHRSQTSTHGFTDDATIKEQALIAAMAAFEKNNGNHSSRAATEHSDIQRRRSQRGPNSEGEGSHFQTNHVSRRRSTKSFSMDFTDNAKGERPGRSTIGLASSTRAQVLYRGSYEATTSDADAASSHVKGSSLAFRCIRKPRSLYGACSNQHETSIDDMSLRAQPTSDSIQSPDVMLHSISEMESFNNLTTNALILENNAACQVDPDISKARNQHLQRFQKQRIRYRPSLMLSSFRKHQEKNKTQPTGSFGNVVTYDNLVSSSPSPALASQHKSSQESRSTSVSIKERIRRVFRKSNLSLNLPVQQAEASRPHFGNILTDFGEGKIQIQPPVGSHTTQTQTIAPTQHAEEFIVQGNQPLLAPSSTHSEIAVNTTKSRASSWADSTVTTTAVNRCSNPLGSIQEHTTGGRGLSNGESRDPSDGTNIFRRMTRKPNNCGDLVPLALRDGDSDNVDMSTVHASSRQPSTTTATFGSAYNTLPSQRRASSLLSSKASQIFHSTVRAITPDNHVFHTSKLKIAQTPNYHLTPTTSKSDLPSTVSETTQRSKTSLSFAKISSLPRIRNRLHKLSPKTTKPTAEQIASRVERSNDRWKSPLEESSRSLYFLHSPQDGERVQHIFQSTPTGSPLEKIKTTDPANAGDCGLGTRTNVISPSLYSRETDCESIPVVSCRYGSANESKAFLPSPRSDEVGTKGISVSQSIENHQVDFPQQPHQLQTSDDWPSYLPKDAADTSADLQKGIALNDNITIKRKDRCEHRREHAQILDDENITVGSVNEKRVQIQASQISIEERPLSRSRREHTQEVIRPTSRMNDRFPMIETGRSSSRAQRKPTPPTNRLHSKARSSPTMAAKGKMKAEENTPVKDSPRYSQNPELFHLKSTINFNNRTTSRNSSSLVQTITSATSTSISPNQLRVPTAKTPGKARLSTHKSTPQIRLHPASSLENTSLAALRTGKPLTPIPPSTNRAEFLDGDQTIINIYKGPYGCSDDRLALHSSLKENARPLALRRIGDMADDGVAQGAAIGEQKLAESFSGDRRLRKESPEGSDGGGESLAFI